MMFRTLNRKISTLRCTATRALAGVLALCQLSLFAASISAQTAPAVPSPSKLTIVLIGGDKQGYPRAEHDYPDGVLAIERLIKGSPQLQALQPKIKTFPEGFPKDLTQIADADVIILYFGEAYVQPRMISPLEDPAHLAAMQKLMAKGAGLIALHQASTLADQASPVPLADWLGGVRFGKADRSTAIVPISISGTPNPVANGLKAFEYLDEFYPTITFSTTTKVTPILTAKVDIQTRNNKSVFLEPPSDHVIAWAAERANGGRSFGFTGAHYLATFDVPQIRTALLNAILWTAKLDVPTSGATTDAVSMRRFGAAAGAASVEHERVLLPHAETIVEPQTWGKLEWFASRALGNSLSMTVGQATISVGMQNPVHRHPNCDEILRVLQGHIMNRVGDKQFEMGPGDTVTIPEGTWHNARNIGKEDAVLSIVYSSPDRISIGEQ